MFLLNSCLGLLSAARFPWRPFSRSYGAILPSSLTMLLPSALVSSTCLPVSVCGTGPVAAIAAFLGRHSRLFATLLRSASHISILQVSYPLPRSVLAPCFHSGLVFSACVPAVLCHRSTGFSTCPPSPTRLRLGLGPGLPRADQLYPGTLGHPAWMILTSISLLIPAFSLRCSPPLLSVWLLPAPNAPLPVCQHP